MQALLHIHGNQGDSTGTCWQLLLTEETLILPLLPLPLALYPRGCPSPTCQPAPHDFKSCHQIWLLLLPWDIDHLFLRHKDRVENFGKCCVWYNNIQWRSCKFEVFLKTLSHCFQCQQQLNWQLWRSPGDVWNGIIQWVRKKCLPSIALVWIWMWSVCYLEPELCR